MSKHVPLTQRNKIDASIFANNYGQPYCDKKLFLSLFDKLPNQIIDYDIDGFKFGEDFKKEYKNDIIKSYYTLRLSRKKDNKKEDIKDDLYFIFKSSLLVYVDVHKKTIKILFDETTEQKALLIKDSFKNYTIIPKDEVPEMHLITSSQHGLGLTSMDLLKMETDLTAHYNDDFLAIHNTIIKRLMAPKDKGVVILHGAPGTGKTSYIRHLISTVDKKVIFLPPNLAQNITGPDLINLLIENPNAILIIEDAENIVVDRDKTGVSPVSAILNISDGLLSDCLQIQIICSFNTSLDNVDKALLRKGRLIAKYDFKPLTSEKANALSSSLGFQPHFNAPTSLTEIFNQKEDTYQLPQRKAIGF
ncbi:hypothetical protein SCB49_02449 [unidentified eubacterium SCB49]|nr:hypothetical protein SCB49_02449 [unidentified eubacterium SCB49]